MNTISIKQKPTFRFVVISIAVLIISLLFSEMFLWNNESNEQETKLAPKTTEDLGYILEKISGVGRVEVYFHYKESTEKSTESEVSFFQWTSDSRGDKEELIGILVVAEGARDKRVQNNLIKTLSSVLQIAPHRIVIQEMEMEDK
ncbi:hypothetical protein [Psychrobacillus lasiicapitis]|uniref:Stage III sporulation protein AG n=1 Tax=Psychrobacillus lasiicapitis TaxID=1636719 RepID=A0A544TAL7_9BACI|nr:hypothetical protein [Psychrobacillus lasiicapitis]TQR14510.1 hypothetical protein FG382_08625 [Psychrobacillus lasiicapitis]